MEAVLYVCHGSRIPKASEMASDFIKKCMIQLKDSVSIQEHCFLELATPTIDEAFESCIDQGATTISVLPVLLLTAAHAKIDIPEELMKLKQKYPQVTILYGRPIGVHPNMINILEERIHDSGEDLTSDSMILLVGRGSSDPDVTHDLSEIASLLSEKTRVNSVLPCYLTAAEPSFEEGLIKAKQSGNKKVFVVPYLLFTGILMKTMEKTINNLSEGTDQTFILCSYLGYHPHLEEVIKERVNELLQNSDLIKEISDVSNYAGSQ